MGARRALELTERRRDGYKRHVDLGLENGCLLGATKLGLWTVVHVLTRENEEERAALMVGASRVVQPLAPSCSISPIEATPSCLRAGAVRLSYCEATPKNKRGVTTSV